MCLCQVYTVNNILGFVRRLHIYNQVVGFKSICDLIYSNDPKDFNDLMEKFGFKPDNLAFKSHDEKERCLINF